MKCLLPILLVLAGCGEGSRLNDGARVGLYEGATNSYLESFRQDTVAVIVYTWPETIHLGGYLGNGGRQMLHEYEHLVEERLHLSGNEDAVVVVRQAFRDLCGPSFELGHDDLMADTP